MPTSQTATHWLFVIGANTTGTMHSAQTSIAVLRAALAVQPRLSRRELSHPPPIEPTSASR